MTEKVENTLREAENQVTIEGLLMEKQFERKKLGDGREFIEGKLSIETKENEVHDITMFSMKLKKDGTANGIYKSLETIADKYKTVAEVGRYGADKVRTTAGKITLNEYYGQDEQLRSFPQISTTFLNRIQADEEYNPRAEFETELYVSSVKEEVGKDDEETGRVELSGYIPVYEGKVIPFTFKVPEGEAAEYVLDNYEVGSTVFIYGDIINFKEVVKNKRSGAFGKDQEKVTYNTIREYLVTGGYEPYDEDDAKAYDQESIKKALIERELKLEEMKKKSKEKKNNEKKSKKSGFGSKSKTDKKIEISDDDLPF